MGVLDLEREIVIFRADKELNFGRRYYYIVFAEDYQDGLYGCLSCYPEKSSVYRNIEGFTFEAYSTISLDYYRSNTRAIKRDSFEATSLLKAIETLYPDTRFIVHERLTIK